MSSQETRQAVFDVKGMHCRSCAASIDMALEDVDGIIEVQTTHEDGTSRVCFNPSLVSEDDIVAVIARAGYHARLS